MSKFIYVHPDTNRVVYVADTRPIDASGQLYVQVDNDAVAEHWWVDPETGSLSQYRPYTVGEVRTMRNEKLSQTDWMVTEDSPYNAVGQESNLAAIKTYRQALRDFPDESASYNENNIVWPILTLS